MRIPALLLLLAVLVLSGCGGNGDDNGGGSSSGGGTVVKITDDGFEPSSLTVSSGDTVTFDNESSDDSWPASDVHPTHQNYPGFDAKKPLLSGESYSFTFTKTGEWGYHNHLEPDVTGTIVVE
jgi:plastocyanin